MLAFSVVHWIILFVVAALWIVPLYRILDKAGLSKGLAFVAILPPLALIIVWVIAFARWRVGETRENF